MATGDFDEILRIQRQMQKRIAEEKQTDDSVEILMLINEIAPNPSQRIQKEMLLIEGGLHGFSVDYMEKTIDRLIKDRVLFIPAPGYLQRR